MGEIAEMMLNGFLDEETGEVIDGSEPGYPRRMSEMRDCDFAPNWGPIKRTPEQKATRRAKRARKRARQKAKRAAEKAST